MSAQPPCLPAQDGIPAGNDAPGCSLCGPIYQGSTMGYGPSAPGSAGFPCGTIENNQFISIIADDTGTLEATILASNCQNGQGVQLIIYDQAFNPVSNCFSPQGINLPGNVLAGGLTPGEQYWIMIDGFAGDICDILLTVSGGISIGPPAPPGPFTITPDTSPLCPGAVVCYSIDDVDGAFEYEWRIPANATIVSGGGLNDTEVCVEFTDVGGGVVVVTPSNPCFPGIPALTPVLVLPILPTILLPEFICLEKFPVTREGIVCPTPGPYEQIYKTALGCDSVVSFVLLPIITPPNQIDTTICDGDCIMIGFDCYDQAGTFRIELSTPDTTSQGCDSVIILTINKLVAVSSIAEPDSIGCDPGETVNLNGSSSSAGIGVTYNWTTYDGGTLAGASDVNFTTASSPGSYVLTVTVTDSTGLLCIDRDTVEVFQDGATINIPAFSQAETEVCNNQTAIYSITAVTGAFGDGYEWTIPSGAVIVGASNGTSIEVDFENAVSGEICVTANGDCGASPQRCIPVLVKTTPNSDFTATPIICLDSSATIIYIGDASPFANYFWNFNGGTPATVSGPGPHQISWGSPGNKTVKLYVEENDCTSENTEHTVQVDPVLDAPVISCTSTQNSITFTWNDVPNANNYSVSINGAAPTNETTTSFTISPLNPGDQASISVEANGATTCPGQASTADCVAQNCDTINLNITPVADICRDASTGTLLLTANPSGSGGGTFSWNGPGTSLDGTFDPQAANIGINVISLEYIIGTCTYVETVEINVHNVPESDFTITTPVCEGSEITATYTGSASSDANFDWDFGQGQILSGIGGGPFQILCPVGQSAISLTVVENGCTSPTSVQVAEVETSLPLPVINCISSTSEEVVMGWDLVPGAINYVVTASGGNVNYTDRTVTFSGLSPNDQITIEVIAEGTGVCPPSRATATCEATNCPDLDIIIDPVGPFCDNGNNSITNLSATAGNNSGNFTWSGPGVSQPNLFDPNSSTIGAGILTVRVTYQKDNCSWASSVDIEILDVPSAAFEVDGPICIDETATVTYTGGADPANSVFNWNFQSGNNTTAATDAGPFEIDWTTTGTQTISLTVEENGCISEAVAVDVQVDDKLNPPIISCDADQNSIDFNWLPVVGALQYDAVVTGGNATNPTGIFDGTFNYNFTGLNPGNTIEITVTATGNTACGPVETVYECIAQDCPDYDVVMPIVQPICLYGNELPFNLMDSMAITNSLGQSLKDSINLIWNDGNAGNIYVTQGGQFFPNAAGSSFGTGDVPITVEIEYPKGSGCFKTYNSVIRLNPKPDNALVLAPKICLTETAEASLSAASDDPDAIFDWNFGSANILSGESAGPYVLVWDADILTDEIGVQITEFGCVSDYTFSTIEISQELNVLDANLRCNPTTTTNSFIEFNWDDVAGATDYDVVVLTPTAPLPGISGNSATFDNLNPRDEIEIELTVSDANSACPPVSITKTCTAIACPTTSVEIDPLTNNCIPANGSSAIQLTAQLFDDPTSGSGDLIFSGDMVSATGLFSPNAEGNYTVAVSYQANGCSYNSTLDIQMWATPIADFEVTPIICVTDAALINFTGFALNDAVFDWDFDGALGANADDKTPAPISWNPAEIGIRNLVLNIENHGCFAAPTTQPVQVDPELLPLNIQCGNASTTGVDFGWDSDANVNEYEVSIKINNGDFELKGNQNTPNYSLTGLIPDAQSLVEIEITATGNTVCGPITETKVCRVEPCPDVVVNIEPMPEICLDENAQPLIYFADISNGGLGSGDYNFSGSGLNNVGLFNPAQAGVGVHSITVNYTEQGCDYQNTIEVTVNELPTANAGETQILSCFDLEVEIGNNSPDPTLNYVWIFDGSQIGNDQNIYVEDGGNYTLEVTDPMTGCTDSDVVFVDASVSNPNILAEINEISCFGRNDGILTINGMENGTPPFRYSINGEDFSNQTYFSNLSSGTYTVIGRDANGCEDEVTFEITEPDDLTVEIIITAGDNPVPAGDSIRLEAITNYAPDLLSSIDWSPTEYFAACDETNITNCLSFWVTPTGQTVYSVRIENLNGCVADNVISIIGSKNLPVYIPSGFSPDGNGDNDYFGVFGDPEVVANIRAFKIFDRWGEKIYENYDFPPVIESGSEAVIPADLGWDGTHRGKPLNSGVFVYYAEVEFYDGTVQILKGDVTIK